MTKNNVHSIYGLIYFLLIICFHSILGNALDTHGISQLIFNYMLLVCY